MEPSGFSLVFKGKTRMGDELAPPEGQNGSPKITKLKRPENPEFVFSLQNNWFREMARKPPNTEGSDPKSGRKCPLYLESHFRVRDQKKPKYATF